MVTIDYPTFPFDSDLTRSIIRLERARADLSTGTTPRSVYIELRSLFQLLTSIMSARIEGNRTSIFDAVSGAARPHERRDEGVDEILNIQQGVEFVDAHIAHAPIDHLFIRELHSIVVRDLRREGDLTPGAYRLGEVSIGRSSHRPPWPSDVPDHMSALIDFVAQDPEPQMQLLQVAVAHHRFLWIHPFSNGNGRVSRLVTYAMLAKQGFTSAADSRTINPTAVFGADRNAYYENLELADSLTNDGLVSWCAYVLGGLHSDLQRLSNLRDASFVANRLIVPAVDRMRASGAATSNEAAALRIAALQPVVRAADLVDALPGSASSRSHAIRRLIDRRLLRPTAPNARSYELVFSPNDLTLHLVNRLDAENLLPTILRDDSL